MKTTVSQLTNSMDLLATIYPINNIFSIFPSNQDLELIQFLFSLHTHLMDSSVLVFQEFYRV